MLVRQVIFMLGMCTLAIARPSKRVAVVEKRIPSDTRIAKRFLTLSAQAKPAVEYHTGYISMPSVDYQTGFIPIQTNEIRYYDPSTQLYYYVLPDGSIKYEQGTSQVQVQLPQIQISQPIAEESSSGGLLSFLQKPLTAAGNIIQKTGDVASDIISLPFDAGRQIVAGVGLDDTAVGQLATGILNVGEGIEQTKLNILSNVAQAPFRIGANIAGSLDEE